MKVVIDYTVYFFKNFRDTWGQLLLLVIPLSLSVPKAQTYVTERWYVLTLVILLFVIGFIQTTKFQVSYGQLRKEFESTKLERDDLQEKLESIPERVVKSLFYYLKFNFNERVTIYRFDGDNFIPTGRYSKNVEYKKSGRDKYPRNEGFISLAWNNGEFDIDQLPDPANRSVRYIQKIKSCCLVDEAVINSMKMKSRAYYCITLDDEHDDPIAVIVFESTNVRLPLPTNEIRELLKGPLGQLLINTLKVNTQ